MSLRGYRSSIRRTVHKLRNLEPDEDLWPDAIAAAPGVQERALFSVAVSRAGVGGLKECIDMRAVGLGYRRAKAS